MEVGVGLALTAGVTGLLVAIFGASAIVAGATFGLLATAIQAVAVTVMKRGLDRPFRELMKRWGVGMGLRVVGVALIAVAVAVDRERFPPLPAAFGYLGVMVPLLFMEIRYLK